MSIGTNDGVWEDSIDMLMAPEVTVLLTVKSGEEGHLITSRREEQRGTCEVQSSPIYINRTPIDVT